MGILFGGWTNDPYEEGWLKKIAEIGQEAYDKEQEEWRKNQPPIRYSSTEPKVTKGDIIGLWDSEKKELTNESYVTWITTTGDIMCHLIDQKQRSDYMWKGPYHKVCSALKEEQ